MACFIIGAGSFYGLPVSVQRTDMVIAADGGWYTCRENGITPTLLVADFDSLDAAPAFDHILRLPVEKDDTDMIRAVKEGFGRGEREFHLLGGMGGHRTDHTVANMQTLAYIARRGGQGWLYGNGERFTAICDGGAKVQRMCTNLPQKLPASLMIQQKDSVIPVLPIQQSWQSRRKLQPWKVVSVPCVLLPDRQLPCFPS